MKHKQAEHGGSIHAYIPGCQLQPFMHTMPIASSPHPCIAYIHPYLLRVLHMVNTRIHACTSLRVDGVAFDPEQKYPPRSRACMELHLITSKHVQLGHAQAWCCIWSRANFSSMITIQHGVAFDQQQTSPACHARAWSCI